MLTINDSPNKKQLNTKLIISCLVSTALVGSAGVYLYSQSSNNYSNNNGSFLNKIPEEFSGIMEVNWVDPYDYFHYSMNGVFNKFNDENSEWTVEAHAKSYDGRQNKYIQHIIKNDRMYVGTNNTIDCTSNFRQIGYSQLKYAILRGNKVEDSELSKDILYRSKDICKDDYEKLVIESGDFGTLLICTKVLNNKISGGVFGKEWDLKFNTVDTKHEIKVPFELNSGVDLDRDTEHMCKINDKFKTVKDWNEEFLKKMDIENHKFSLKEKFPFKIPEERNLKRNKRNGNLGSGSGSRVNKNEPTSTLVKCMWMHGAGHFKGIKKAPGIIETHAGNDYMFYTENDPDKTLANEGRYFNWETSAEYLGDNTNVDNFSMSGSGYMVNGGSRLYYFKPMQEYPDIKESWYPHFIKGRGYIEYGGNTNPYFDNDNDSTVVLHDKKGVLHELCNYGNFWEANSTHRLYNNPTIMNEAKNWFCPNGEICTIGTDQQTVLFTHSFGGLLTSQVVVKGYVLKGPNMTIAMTQVPLRGSVGGNFIQELCTTQNYDGGNYGLTGNGIFKMLHLAFREMAYCRNDLTAGNFSVGLMIGLYEYERSDQDVFQQDYFMDYKYCGSHPGGMEYDTFEFNWYNMDNILDIIANVIHVGWSDMYTNNASGAMDWGDNSQKLLVLAHWECRFMDFCEQLYCNTGGYDCTWRGCSHDLDCNTTRKYNWKHGHLDWKSDGMVSLTTCRAKGHTQFHNVKGGSYSPTNPDYNDIEPMYTLLTRRKYDANNNTMNAEDGIQWDWSLGFWNDAGLCRDTIQQTNHEDGTGTNGNSALHSRAPINWYTNVVHEVYQNGGNVDLSLDESNDRTYVKWDYNTVGQKIDLDQSGGYYVFN